MTGSICLPVKGWLLSIDIFTWPQTVFSCWVFVCLDNNARRFTTTSLDNLSANLSAPLQSSSSPTVFLQPKNTHPSHGQKDKEWRGIWNHKLDIRFYRSHLKAGGSNLIFPSGEFPKTCKFVCDTLVFMLLKQHTLPNMDVVFILTSKCFAGEIWIKKV